MKLSKIESGVINNTRERRNNGSAEKNKVPITEKPVAVVDVGEIRKFEAGELGKIKEKLSLLYDKSAHKEEEMSGYNEKNIEHEKYARELDLIRIANSKGFFRKIDGFKKKATRFIEEAILKRTPVTFEHIFSEVKHLGKSTSNGDLKSISLINNNMDILGRALEQETTNIQAIETLSRLITLKDDIAESRNIFIEHDFNQKRDAKLKLVQKINQKKVIEIFFQALPKINQVLISGSEDQAKMVMGNLRDIVFSSRVSHDIKHECYRLFEHNLERISKIIKGDQDFRADLLAISCSFENKAYNEDSIKEIKDKLLSDYPEERMNAKQVIARMLSRNSGNGAKLGYEFLEIFLKSTGVDSNKMLEAWRSGMEKGAGHVVCEERSRYIKNNLEVIEQIEKERPGAINSLNKEFGIYNFARHPMEMLIDQFDHKDDNDLPYGVMFFPRMDWISSAYRNSNNVQLDLFKQVANKYYIRIIECESKIDVAKKFVALNKRYSNKISFAYFMAHGDKDVMELGEYSSTDRGLLKSVDMEGAGVQRMANFFSKGATLIIESCLTGLPGGIGEQIAKRLNMEVIAPEESSQIKKISVEFKNDIPRFSVKYSDGVGMRYKPASQ